jgi:hypothetical protein
MVIRSSSFIKACVDGNIDRVQWMLNHPHFQFEVLYNEGIRWAAHNGNTEIVKTILIDSRTDHKKVLEYCDKSPTDYKKILLKCKSELRGKIIDDILYS